MTFIVVRLLGVRAFIHHALDILVIRRYETWRKLGGINNDENNNGNPVDQSAMILVVVQIVVITFRQTLVAHIMNIIIRILITMMNISLAIILIMRKCKKKFGFD